MTPFEEKAQMLSGSFKSPNNHTFKGSSQFVSQVTQETIKGIKAQKTQESERHSLLIKLGKWAHLLLRMSHIPAPQVGHQGGRKKLWDHKHERWLQSQDEQPPLTG